ncbi:MAG: hypothetical protein L0Z53_09805, partial [Acidobacteriales bacterium]|nr:hypothetical protein [Terriglobales bacterium]
MSNKSKQLGQTVITLALPEDHAMERQGSLIAKYDSGDGKQSLAYMMPFRYSTLADIARAVDSAVQALEAVKRNPPQVTVPAEPVRTPKVEPKAKPSQAKSKKKKKPALDDFPMDDEDETRSNPAETDAAATDTVIAEAPSPEPAQPT